MTFVSMEYALLLLVSFALYWLLPWRWRGPLLLAASYLFYAWWNPFYLWLLLASTVVDYVAAQFIHRHANQRWRRAGLWTSVVANLGLLGYFKYANFGLTTLHAMLGSWASSLPQTLEIVLPVGISFYTFQTMAYTIDVYRGRIEPERNPIMFALFVAYFPQLVAGPIERAGDLLPQLRRRALWDAASFEQGVRLLLWGFAKKLVVADRLAAVAGPILAAPSSAAGSDLTFASLGLFTMLYFDFSAYTDMARGSAALFGVRLSENFRAPLAATSIADFWRRWHMTLSTWVRDYVYQPLGGYRPRALWHNLNISLVTMGLIGLWHGANWTYVLWGLQHGLLLFIHQRLHLRFHRRIKRLPRGKAALLATGGWVLTMALHGASMVWFFSTSVPQALRTFDRIATPATWAGSPNPATAPGFLVLGAIWAVQAVGARVDLLERLARAQPLWRALGYGAIFFTILCLSVTRSPPFIYFQF
jgi:alginate O-acetyltransferase complex protein AlgI